MKPALLIALLLPAFALLAGCASTLQPLRDIQQVDYWVPATAPATTPATQTTTQAANASATQLASASTATAPASEPATRPDLIKKTKLVDPNQTVRYLYRGNYDHIWQESMALLTHMGFRLDRQDYRLGALTTLPLHQPEFLELWKRDNTDLKHALEASVNDQRHTVRITVSPVEGRPEFYAIAVQVLVERQVNPSENIGGLLFTTGSAFGGTSVTLQSDYAEAGAAGVNPWLRIGHDTALENKILDLLFQKI